MPVSPAGPARPRPAMPPHVPSVLVVDDLPDVADSLSELLALHGFDVRTAYDGPTALELAAADMPDAVVTDLGMPRMSGWELAERLRDTRPARPPFVVAVSGWGAEEHRRRSAEAGIALHLTKPPDVGALVAALNGLRRPGGADELNDRDRRR